MKKQTVKEMYDSLMDRILKEIPLDGKDSFDRYIISNNLANISNDIIRRLLATISDEDIAQIYDIYRESINLKRVIPYKTFVEVAGKSITDILFVAGTIKLYNNIIWWNKDTYPINKIFNYRRIKNPELNKRYMEKYGE